MKFNMMKMKENYYGIVETIIADFLILVIFFLSYSGRIQFLNLNIHPFIIVVAVVALRYGNIIGLISAGVSSLFYLYVYLSTGRDLYLFFIDFSYYKFFVMFFLTAIILGKFRDNQKNTIANLKKDIKDLETRYDRLKKINKKNSFIKEQFKKRIIDSNGSLYYLHEIVKSLESLDPEQIFTELMGILKKFIKAKSVSIYVFDSKKNFLRLKARFGGKTKLKSSIDLEKNNILKKALNEEEYEKQELYNKLGSFLLVSPIRYRNEILGMVAVEELEFEMLTDFTETLFKLIIKCVDKSLYAAIISEKTETSNKYHQNTNVMKLDKFKNRLQHEKRRREEYGMDYTLLKFKNNDFDLKEINNRMNYIIRDVDVLSYDEEKDVIIVLLPATPKEFVDKIEKRIMTQFDFELEKAL
ncbi:MAG: hypothetical protein FXF47_05905 [Candidatus Mcinerneyibacterium aminivorans]|uniref:GAF domain-containing protein n=1 Tax=Candidatus Mcinerneyibacterium aminivorans TaxID=2703815 RepID=A0A5D0MKL7_9BACT|nr:MAG: hypothetical protein FXF47_05905 [Candidatus Mcinerneyibacterium aminivorans]